MVVTYLVARFWFQCKTLDMSSLEYHPTSTLFLWASSWVMVFSRNWMNFSSQGYARPEHQSTGYTRYIIHLGFLAWELFSHTFNFGLTCLYPNHSLSKPQDWYSIAISKWSLVFHSLWSHSGTCNLCSSPCFALSSQRRLSLAFSAFFSCVSLAKSQEDVSSEVRMSNKFYEWD